MRKIRRALYKVGILAAWIAAVNGLFYFLERVDWSWSSFILGLTSGVLLTVILRLFHGASSSSEGMISRDEAFTRPEGISDLAWARMLSEKYQVDLVDLREVQIEDECFEILPAKIVRKYQVLPIAKTGTDLVLAMADPANIFAVDHVGFMTGYKIRPVVAPESQIIEYLSTYPYPLASLSPENELK